MAIELPDVEQEWTANVAPYIEAMAELIDSVKAARDESLAAIEEIQAGIDHLDGKTILITVDTVGAGGETGAAAAAGEAAAQAAAYHEAGDAAAEAAAKETAAGAAAAASSKTAAAGAYDEAAAYKWVTAAMSDAAKAMALVALANEALAFSEKESAAAAAASTVTASNALRGIIGAMQGAGTATRFFGLSLSALHWIVGVSAEILAVTIPAIIAFGAGLDCGGSGGLQRRQPHDRPVDRCGVHGWHVQHHHG